MIIIHPLKIAFQDIPKVGSTSLLNWLYNLLYGKNYQPSKGFKYVHGWITSQQNDVIENHPLETFKCPEGYFVFCVIRDPVKRILSAYSNRVLHNKELDFGKKNSINEEMLAARPSINYFIDNLERYQNVSTSIYDHTRPLIDYTGTDTSIYDKIFDLSEMSDLRQVLIKYWQTHRLIADNQDIPEIPHLQTSRKKIPLERLTPEGIEKCLSAYERDYETFTTLDKNKIQLEWQESYLATHNNNAVSDTAIVKAKSVDEIVLMSKTYKKQLNISAGEIKHFCGLVLLKPNMADTYKLIVRDARGEWQVTWKQPSPKIAKQYPDNPYALNAGFTTQGLQIKPGRTVKVFIEDDLGKRNLLFVIKEKRSCSLV